MKTRRKQDEKPEGDPQEPPVLSRIQDTSDIPRSAGASPEYIDPRQSYKVIQPLHR